MIDEVYVRMCREATEIQEEWEPKPGDLVYNLMPSIHADYNVDILINSVEEDCEHCINKKEWKINRILLTEIGLNYFGKAQIGSEIPLKQRFKWLPRQEDLQEIYYKETQFPSFEGLLEDFNLFIESPDTIIQSHHNFNTIWLEFVMYQIYGKEWDGTTWEAI